MLQPLPLVMQNVIDINCVDGHQLVIVVSYCWQSVKAGADPGEVKWVNFHTPFSEPPSFFSLSPQPGFGSFTLLQKFTPPIQNPGSPPERPISQPRSRYSSLRRCRDA